MERLDGGLIKFVSPIRVNLHINLKTQIISSIKHILEIPPLYLDLCLIYSLSQYILKLVMDHIHNGSYSSVRDGGVFFPLKVTACKSLHSLFKCCPNYGLQDFPLQASKAWPLHLTLDSSSNSPNQNRLMHIYVLFLSSGCSLSLWEQKKKGSWWTNRQIHHASTQKKKKRRIRAY